MKKISAIIMIVGLVGCSAIISRNVPNHSLQEIIIPTIQCGMCVARIDKALNGVDGILKYKVELDALKVKVKYDNVKISLQQIEQIISKTGYQANTIPADPEAYKKLDMCCRLPKDRK